MFKRGYLIFFCLLFIKLINILNYFVLERNLYSICSKLIGGELLVSLYKSQVNNILFDCHLFDFDLSFIFDFLKKLSLNTTNLFFIIIEFNILTFKLIIIVIVCKNLFITCIQIIVFYFSNKLILSFYFIQFFIQTFNVYQVFFVFTFFLLVFFISYFFYNFLT